MLLTLLKGGSLNTTGSATVSLSAGASARPQVYDGQPQGALAGAAFAAGPFGGLILSTIPPGFLSFASTASGSVSLTGAATASLAFASTGSGSLTLTGAATDVLKFASTGSGTVDLLGAATDVLKFATTGSGSLTLTGNAYSGGASPTTGSGSLSLSASAVPSLAFATTGSGSLSLSASAVDSLTTVLSSTGSGSLTLSAALTGATVGLPTRVQTSTINPAIGGSIYQFHASADSLGKTVSLYAGSTLLLTSASHVSGTFTGMQLTLRWDSTAMIVLSSSGTVLIWHDLSSTERSDLVAGVTVGSWNGSSISTGTAILGSWSYRLLATMKKSIGRSPRLWSVWATYSAGLDFLLDEVNGTAWFQDGTSQEEYADTNLTVLRGGFGYDLVTGFASRVANAGGVDFLSTSPVDATEILVDPYRGSYGSAGSGYVSLSASANASLGTIPDPISGVIYPVVYFAGATFGGSFGPVVGSVGSITGPTTASAQITLTATTIGVSLVTTVVPITAREITRMFAGATFGGSFGPIGAPASGGGTLTTNYYRKLTFAGSTLGGSAL